MADHFAQQVVDAVVSKLTGLTTTGANVFSEDDYPREKSKLPCVNVIADGFRRESRGIGGSGRPQVSNFVSLKVQGVARASGSARRTAWQIAKEVEERWLDTTANERLTGLVTPPVQRAQLGDVDVRVDIEADGAYAIAEMTFQVQVLSTEGNPDLV